MKLGIDTAFNRVNDAGGVEGRMLKLIAADDGFEPTRTVEAMKQLYERDQVFGMIGNVGTGDRSGSHYPTRSNADAFLRRLHRQRTLSAMIRRIDMYSTIGRAMRRKPTPRCAILLKCAGYHPGRSRFSPSRMQARCRVRRCSKVIRSLGASDSGILRLNYQRNTVDVEDAVNQLKAQKVPIKAVVMISAYRAAAKFIEKTRDLFPGMLYSNISFSAAPCSRMNLMLLGPRYAAGAIVTQVVPAVSGYSSIVLEYKNALAKYFPGEAADYVSLEGYVAANVLIEALKRTGTATRYREAHRRAEEHARSRSGLEPHLVFWPRRTPGLAQDLGTALE